MTHRVDRRGFLTTLSKAGIGLGLARAAPLVGGLMATRHAHAQSAVKRAIFVYTPDGAPNGMWLPENGVMKAASLAYDGLQSVCHFRETDIVSSGHGLARKCLGELRWSRDWTSDTLDQQVASVLGANAPYTSYTFGVQTDAQNYVGRRGGSSVPAENSPAAAYEQLFGGAPPVQDTGAFLARKQSVLDVNRTALASLRGRLGAFERETLEKHATAIQEVEARLVASVSTEPAEGCESPAWNANGYPTQGPVDGDVGVFAHQAELQSDVIVAAMACGLLNVATLQLGWHQAVWYGHDTAFRGDHHGSCHAGTAQENAEMTNYLSRCVAYLIRKLVETDDPAVPGTKLIDNTVLVQVTDMGDGRDHSGGDGPNLIATRMPTFRTGVSSRGGNNLQVLEAVVEGLGLGAYKGTDRDAHKIWPHGGGTIADGILS